MKSKERGFTLIELIIVIGIWVILLNMSINLIVSYYKIYQYSFNKSTVGDDIDDACMSMDIILKSNLIEDIKVKEDEKNSSGEIHITNRTDHFLKEGKKHKIIGFNKEKELITMVTRNIGNNSSSYNEKNTNVISRNIKRFSIKKKGNLYYLIIVDMNGDERIQCL